MANELEIILRARNETEKAFNQLKGQQQDLLKDLSKLVAQYLSVAAAAKLVTSSLQAQAEQEAAINQLNLALANQGRFTQETSKALQDYSSHLQETTAFADEAVLAAEALLASFGMNEDQIKATTKAAVDFAAATRTDLQSATNLLGKAFVGSTEALSRYGIVVDDNVSKSEKFNAALEQVQQRFGGSAAAQTSTYTGQLAQLKNQFGEVQEGLGKLLGEMSGGQQPFEMLIGLAKRMADFFGKDLVQAIGEVRGLFLDFIRSFVDDIVRLSEFASKIPGSKLLGFTPEAIGQAKAWSTALETAAEQIRNEAAAAADASGKTLQFANSTVKARVDLEALAKAQAALSKELDFQEKVAQGVAASFAYYAEQEQKAAVAAIELAAVQGQLRAEIDAQMEESLRAQADAQKGLQEMAEAVGEALKRRNQELIRQHYELAGSMQAFGETIGGSFGMATQLVGGLLEAMTALGDESLRSMSNLQKASGALQGAMAAYKSGSVLGGVGKGAAAGAMFGPIGAGIGAVVGGLFGFLGSKKKKQEEEQRKAVEAQNKALEEQRKKIEALTTAMGGLDLMAKGVTASTQDGFDRLGRYAVAAFSAFIKQTGDIFGALEKLGPSLDSLISKQKEYGFTVSAAFQRLLDLRNVVTANKDVADSISGLNQLMKSFGEAGVTNGALFQDFAADAGALYNTLIARGTDANAAIGLMQPTLQQLWEQQKKYGAVTDESTAALLRQAEQQGLVGAQFQSVNEKILDVLLAIGEVLGAKIPDALRKMGAAASDVYGGMISDAQRYAAAGSAGYGGSNSYTPGLYTGPPPEQYAAGSGGIRDFGRGTPATLHGREGVFTEGQITALIAAARGGGRPIVIQGTGLSKEDLAWAMDRALKNDERGLKTRVRRITKGRD